MFHNLKLGTAMEESDSQIEYEQDDFIQEDLTGGDVEEELTYEEDFDKEEELKENSRLSN